MDYSDVHVFTSFFPLDREFKLYTENKFILMTVFRRDNSRVFFKQTESLVMLLFYNISREVEKVDPEIAHLKLPHGFLSPDARPSEVQT